MRSMLISILLVGMALMGTSELQAQSINEGFNDSKMDSVWTWSAHPSITYSLTERNGFMTVKIPGDRLYDIWSNDVNDGMLLLRRDQGNGDWAIETLCEIRSNGHGYQTGLFVWSNPYIMYFWGVKCQAGKHYITYSGEQLGISDFGSKNDIEIDDRWVTLRIEKFGKKLLLQYWDEDDEAFVTYKTFDFKFPVNGVGLMARTFAAEGSDLMVAFDYFKIIK